MGGARALTGNSREGKAALHRVAGGHAWIGHQETFQPVGRAVLIHARVLGVTRLVVSGGGLYWVVDGKRNGDVGA